MAGISRTSVKAMDIAVLENILHSIEEAGAGGADELVILTGMGMIRGRVAHPGDDGFPMHEIPGHAPEDPPTYIPNLEFLRAERNRVIAEDKAENPDLVVIDDAGMIILEEVTITPLANPNVSLKMDQMCLYADQIIGISAARGNREHSHDHDHEHEHAPGCGCGK